MKAKLTEGSVGLGLVKLTLPMIWGVFAVIGFSLADTYFVAQLGTKELAAMSFTFPVVTILGSIAMGLGTGKPLVRCLRYLYSSLLVQWGDRSGDISSNGF